MNHGVFYTLRKHWKKSTFAAIAALYGIHFMTQKHRANIVRRRLCQEAVQYGRQTIKSTAKQRRVVVFFNPKAGSGKTRKLLKDDAVPIFNLAGIDVVYIELDYVGQAKTLVNYLDETTDTIVIAGGSGTVMEVITGLLTKYDEESKQCPLPIGIIPLGDENTLFEKLLPDRCKNIPKARIIGEAALSIVKKESRMIDVMKISPQESGKTIYSLSSVKWGIFRDIASDYDRYWLFGPLKKRMAYIPPVLFNWPPKYSIDIGFGASDNQKSLKNNDIKDTIDNNPMIKEINKNIKTFNSFQVEIDANQTKNLAVSIWPEIIDKKEFILKGAENINTQRNIFTTVKEYNWDHGTSNRSFQAISSRFAIIATSIEAS
ncbi:uncharacterized protein TRIADDRAFT_61027 [Trichoplax adhaerens]|uniref:Acylglycerol kinase, mitochondrial n=1 Tax=Trichoplax adhaerens TaxID=10228 RepID=B3S9U1_TRIAD|nr:hypothetical protein TRIADDRAFT_61027 [Trichoplax adhaerens]EDV20598.1 hypothetical protein TRIADDRAFT_61027 [Trichoplax adhaerens]|eukprot:XP_002117024.1 hypothetical protein TRIADDRAFT_61027 [Trichoplax adhaerens]